MNIPKETIDAIKDKAKTYAGVMVWVNQNPKGEEQLFYEYIAGTSHQAGATEWAAKAEGLVTALEWIKTYGPCDDLTVKFIDNALAKYKEVEPAPAKPIEYMPIHPEDARKPYCPRQFPMHLLSIEQALSNHGQTLQRLKERGGLSVIEMLAVANKKPWSFYSKLKWEDALKMLNDLINKEVSNG